MAHNHEVVGSNPAAATIGEIMAKGKGGAPAPVKNTSGADRKNGKAKKKRPKIFDAIKRRLVTEPK